MLLSYGLKPSGLYRHQRGLGLHRVGYKGGDLHIRIPSLPSTQRRVLPRHGTKSSILYLHSLGVRLMMMIVRPIIVRPMMVVRLSGHPLIRDSLSSPRTRLQRRRVRHVSCLRCCKTGSPSNFMFLSNRVRLPYKCCAPWLLRPIMAVFHVSYEFEMLGYFYILPPSHVNEPPIREARI